MSSAVQKEVLVEAPTPDLTENLSFKEKLGYGFGDMASNLIFSSMSMFLLFFYTDVAGISAAVIGTIMLFTRIFDGLTDIGLGFVVDKTKSKHGKARPWIKWMAIPFAISAVLVFTIPDAGTVGKIVYITITYNLVNLIYTAINIPYGVLNSLITQDQYQRSVLNIFRMFMALIAALSVSMITLPIVSAFGGGLTGWQITFSIYGVIGAVLFFITYYSTKERVQPAVGSSDQKIPMKIGVNALFKNKYWGLMVLFMVVTYLGQGIGSGVNIYFAQYILNDSNLIGTLTLANLIPMMIAMLIISPVVKRLGKRNSMILGLIITIIGTLFILVNPGSVTMVMIGTVIKGIGTAPIIGSMFAMLADTIEYGEWKSGVRTEGLVYSAGSFGTKVGTGLGSAALGWILAFGGYVGGAAKQSDAALLSINALFIYIPLILAVLQLAIMIFYKLDREYPAIMKELQNRSTREG